MYDITKTRMLLTTAVFAAVAAVFAGGANARALAEDGSGIGAVAAAQAAQVSGTFSVDEMCAALEVEQLRGVLINEPAIKAATPSAIQECSQARADVAPTLPRHQPDEYEPEAGRAAPAQQVPRRPSQQSLEGELHRVQTGRPPPRSFRRRGCACHAL